MGHEISILKAEIYFSPTRCLFNSRLDSWRNGVFPLLSRGIDASRRILSAVEFPVLITAR
jgi:hypothetical protein